MWTELVHACTKVCWVSSSRRLIWAALVTNSLSSRHLFYLRCVEKFRVENWYHVLINVHIGYANMIIFLNQLWNSVCITCATYSLIHLIDVVSTCNYTHRLVIHVLLFVFFTCLDDSSNLSVIAGASVGVVLVVVLVIVVTVIILIVLIKSKTHKGEPGFLYPSYKKLCFLFLHVYKFLLPMHGWLNSVHLGHEQEGASMNSFLACVFNTRSVSLTLCLCLFSQWKFAYC